MTQLLFPARRDSFVYFGPGQPIRQPGRVAIYIYLDEACTTLAKIRDLEHHEILGSLLFIDETGLIPEFYGPDDCSVLYSKGTETEVARLDANYSSQIDNSLVDTEQVEEYVDQAVQSTVRTAVVAALEDYQEPDPPDFVILFENSLF